MDAMSCCGKGCRGGRLQASPARRSQMNHLSAAAFGLVLVLGTAACSSNTPSSDFSGNSGGGSGSSGSAAGSGASGGASGTTGTGNLGNGNNNGQLGGAISGTAVSNNLDAGA